MNLTPKASKKIRDWKKGIGAGRPGGVRTDEDSSYGSGVGGHRSGRRGVEGEVNQVCVFREESISTEHPLGEKQKARKTFLGESNGFQLAAVEGKQSLVWKRWESERLRTIVSENEKGCGRAEERGWPKVDA